MLAEIPIVDVPPNNKGMLRGRCWILHFVHGCEARQQFVELCRILEIIQIKLFLHQFGLAVDIQIGGLGGQVERGLKNLKQRLVAENLIGTGYCRGLARKIQCQPDTLILLSRLDLQRLTDIFVDERLLEPLPGRSSCPRAWRS